MNGDHHTFSPALPQSRKAPERNLLLLSMHFTFILNEVQGSAYLFTFHQGAWDERALKLTFVENVYQSAPKGQWRKFKEAVGDLLSNMHLLEGSGSDTGISF